MEIKIFEANEEDLKTILDLQKECYLSEAELYNDFDIPPIKQDLESITNENGQRYLGMNSQLPPDFRLLTSLSPF